MLRRIIGIRSIVNYARYSFSNRKPPKGFEKFVNLSWMNKWWKSAVNEHIEKMKDQQDEYKNNQNKGKKQPVYLIINKEEPEETSDNTSKYFAIAAAAVTLFYLRDKIFPSETLININQFQN